MAATTNEAEAQDAKCRSDLDFERGDQSLPDGIKILVIILKSDPRRSESVRDKIRGMNWMADDDWVVADYDYEQHAFVVPITKNTDLIIARRRVEQLPHADIRRVQSAICSFARKYGAGVFGWQVTVDDVPYGGSSNFLKTR